MYSEHLEFNQPKVTLLLLSSSPASSASASPRLRRVSGPWQGYLKAALLAIWKDHFKGDLALVNWPQKNFLLTIGHP